MLQNRKSVRLPRLALDRRRKVGEIHPTFLKMAKYKSKPMPLLALMLAWLVPGAGHAYIGRVRRGVIIFVTISATFWAGVAMGGRMTIDPVNERWWFIAQMITGVNGVAAWRFQQRTMRELESDEYIGQPVDVAKESDQPTQMSRRAMEAQRLFRIDERLAEMNLAPVSIVAFAYSGVAGLLNLLCIFDAFILSMTACPGEPKTQQKDERTGEAAA